MSRRLMRTRLPATALRLGGAFGAILVLFGAALWVTLATLDQLAVAEQRVAELEEAKHTGHYTAAIVREQYMHQAHTIINWDHSHLDHYEDVVRDTRRATERLRAVARTPAEKRRADEVARLANEVDLRFRRDLLPLIGRAERAGIRELHDETDRLVQRVVELNEELNREFERQTVDARADEARLRSRAEVVVLGCFALAIATAAAVGLIMTRSILRRISKLRAGATEIAKGNLDTRIEIQGNDEFTDLARSFNQMARDLAQHQEELVRSQKLATLGQVAAGVAHEINNPLGVILGYAKLLRRDTQVGGEADDGLRIIEDEARQCQRIVEGLLELARPVKLNTADVDVADLARDAIERLREAGKLDSLRVEPPVAGTRALACGDEAKLRQVISNVLVNAAEATQAAGSIRVDAENNGEDVLLRVTDEGAGIPSDIRARLFEPFFTTKPKGTGLGLAISQAIVDAHHGTIEIASETGKGTSVTIRLPKQARRTTGAAT